jgi:hypothetical protein
VQSLKPHSLGVLISEVLLLRGSIAFVPLFLIPCMSSVAKTLTQDMLLAACPARFKEGVSRQIAEIVIVRSV